jgi:GntR family transcriptional regulator, trigonelline degradation regulator
MTYQSSVLKVTKDTATLRELATNQLRKAIVTLHFKPGQHLVERDLVAATGVSRTSVREALRHLEAEGLVERRANRGLFVAAVGPDEARQIYEIRAALEPAMAQHFVSRASAKQVRELRAALRRVKATSQARDIPANVAALDEFYDVIMRGAANEEARRILHTLRGRMSFLRAVTAARASADYRRGTLEQMSAIVGAAEAHDGPLMARRCLTFVKRSESFAIAVLEQESTAAAGVEATP